MKVSQGWPGFVSARLLQLSEIQKIGRKVHVKITRLIQETCPESIEICIYPSEFHSINDVECQIIPDHFKGLLHTLIDNAEEALRSVPEDQRRPIQVRVSFAHDLVAIDCIDWGKGVAGEYVANLFDPFFTTKEVGEGMGINLFFAREYARSMGGDLVLITPRQPTQFRITLSASPANLAHSA